MNPTLPQADNTGARAAELAKKQGAYRYSYDQFSTIAMAETLTPADKPDLRWIETVAGTLFGLVGNEKRAAAEFAVKHEKEHLGKRVHDALFTPISELRDRAREDARLAVPHVEHMAHALQLVHEEGIKGVFKNILDRVLYSDRKGRAHGIADFSRLFQTLPVPAIAATFQDDASFARMRVAGPNPLMFRRISGTDDRFPVTNAQYRQVMGPSDSLEAAGAEGRLYLADYAAVEGIQLGSYPGGQQKFCEAPLALFAVPAGAGANRSLKAVAIQCSQKPGATSPIFVPADGYAWQMAKTIATIADGQIHQAVSHLAHTHLVTEPMLLATYRQLSDRHPLALLLRPHFEGTLVINDAANRQLTAPQGAVDALLAGTGDASRAIAIAGVKAWNFGDSMLRNALAARGVDDRDALPDYPYRDDSLLLWDAIRGWVASYLKIYYRSDADVAADFELQAWVAEILSPDGGRINGIGESGKIRTLAYLTDALTHIIFTPSAQHAAVNFPQDALMSFAINYPLAGYRAPPKDRGATEQDHLDLLPSLDMALLQMELGHLLGSIHHTALGHYGGGILGAHFKDRRVDEPMRAFQSQLADIETTIGERNQTRASYEFLLPSQIPQSINI